MLPEAIPPAFVAPANWATPSTTTEKGPGGTWTDTRAGTWMLDPPSRSEPRMKKTSTLLSVECLGEVPTQNETVLRLGVAVGRPAAIGRPVAVGVPDACGEGACDDVHPARTAKATGPSRPATSLSSTLDILPPQSSTGGRGGTIGLASIALAPVGSDLFDRQTPQPHPLPGAAPDRPPYSGTSVRLLAYGRPVSTLPSV
jgi:hypothetical protein